mmetsp:Transcript_20584/g.33414  ORF Transcript_20584/g.33414 Transcript_20584/m.33414 type:complete len:613 (+) Transcript_20584:46-1884(+)
MVMGLFRTCLLLLATPINGAKSGTWQPWTWNGYEKFPSLYFAAEPTGYFSPEQVAKIQQFELAIIEFRQGQHIPNAEWARLKGQHMSNLQCKMLKNSTSNPKPCLVYRSGLWAGYFYELQASYLNTQSNFLSPDIDGECSGDMGFAKGHGTLCKYDFRQASVQNWYANTMLAEVATEEHVDGVFIDNGQSIGCDHNAHLTTFSQAERISFMDDQLLSYRQGFEILANANKYAILSTNNQFPQRHGPVLNFDNGCGNTEERIYHALKDVPWARNYEFFMYQLGDYCSAQLKNFINETSHNIPVFVHVAYHPKGAQSSTGGCAEACYLVENNGEATRDFPTEDHFLNFTMAAFLIGMGNGSYFSFSNMNHPDDTYQFGGWADVSWSYYPQYNMRVGRPVGEVQVSNNDYVFFRQFEFANVSVDCYNGNYSIETFESVAIGFSVTVNQPCSQESTVRTSFVSALAASAGVASSAVSSVASSCSSVTVSATVTFPQRSNGMNFYTQFSNNATAALQGQGFVSSFGPIVSSYANVITSSPTPYPTPAPASSTDDEGPDDGVIAGAVIGALIAVIIICVAIYFFIKRRSQTKHVVNVISSRSPQTSNVNVGTSKSQVL